MVTSCFLDHICYKFCCDRRSTLIFFILPRVREERNDRCDTFSARNLARMNHNAKLHQRSVDRPTPSVDNIHILFSYRLYNGHIRFANATSSHLRFREGQTNANNVKIMSSSKPSLGKDEKRTTVAL